MSDRAGTLATPAHGARAQRRPGRRTTARIAALVGEEEAERGGRRACPLSLDGRGGPGGPGGEAEVEQLAERRSTVPVELHDERLTTVTADRLLADEHEGRAPRRKVVDQVAAAVLLQAWLDAGAAGPTDRRPTLDDGRGVSDCRRRGRAMLDDARPPAVDARAPRARRRWRDAASSLLLVVAGGRRGRRPGSCARSTRPGEPGRRGRASSPERARRPATSPTSSTDEDVIANARVFRVYLRSRAPGRSQAGHYTFQGTRRSDEAIEVLEGRPGPAAGGQRHDPRGAHARPRWRRARVGAARPAARPAALPRRWRQSGTVRSAVPAARGRASLEGLLFPDTYRIEDGRRRGRDPAAHGRAPSTTMADAAGLRRAAQAPGGPHARTRSSSWRR